MKIPILFFLLMFHFATVSALTNWSRIGYRLFTTYSETETEFVSGLTADDVFQIDTTPKSGVKWDHILQTKISRNIDLSLVNSFFYSEKSREQQNSFLNNYAKIRLLHSGDSYNWKIQYSNRWFDENNTNLSTLPGIENINRKQFIHNTEINFNTFWKGLYFTANSRFRNLRFRNFAETENSTEQDNDLFSYLKIAFDLNEKFGLFISGQHNNDLNEVNSFDYTQFDIGLNYFRRFGMNDFLRSQIKYYQSRSENIDQLHNISADIRYTKRFGNKLTGFLAYQNHSCLDPDSKKIQRISNLLRLRTKYTFKTGQMRDSFIWSELKFNPENNGNLVSLGWQQFILSNIYFQSEGKFAPDLYKEFSAILEYFFTSGRSVWINNRFSKQNVKPAQNIISIGTTMNF